MKRLNDILLAVAGVDDPLASDPAVPRDALHRAATIGAAMLSTAVFAFVAATALALMLLHAHPWRAVLAPGFGLFWAATTFIIDRALVLSMAQAKWLALLLRLPMAVLIAVGISVSMAWQPLVAENPFLRGVYLLVFILCVVIDLAPVLVKLMAGTHSIDFLLAAKARELELKKMAELEQLESEVAIKRVVLDALRERLPEFAHENGAAFRALFDERLAAQRALATHHEILGQIAELLERSQALRERIKRSAADQAVIPEVLRAIAVLERAAAERVDALFADAPLAHSEA